LVGAVVAVTAAAPQNLVLALLAGGVAVAAVAALLPRWGGLPLLSLPFALLVLPCGPIPMGATWVDAALPTLPEAVALPARSLGSLILLPSPWAGLAILGLVAGRSRLAALLLVIGGLVAAVI